MKYCANTGGYRLKSVTQITDSLPRAANGALPPSPLGLVVGIQLLRGLAALLVILAHANLMMRYPRYFGVSPFDIKDAGIFGVTIFFVISGFIIAIVSLDDDLAPRLAISNFAWRRFVRIVPFLWVAVIAYNALSYVGTRQIEWGPMVRALVIWPVGTLKPNVIWSLRHEVIFYVLFAITMMGTRKHWWLLLAWFLAPVVGGLVLLATGATSIPVHPRLAELASVVLLGSDNGANLQFGVGFLLGILTLKRHPFVAVRLPHGLLWVVLATAAATIWVEWASLPQGLARSVIWTALAGSIVWLGIISRPQPAMIGRVGILLGNASFAIYLTHNGVLLPVFEATRKLHIELPHGLLFLIFDLIALSAGILIHLAVEKPLIAWCARHRRVAPWDREPLPSERP